MPPRRSSIIRLVAGPGGAQCDGNEAHAHGSGRAKGALAFPTIDRLELVALLRGNQWIVLSGRASQLMQQGYVCLIGRTVFVVASDPCLAPVDGSALLEGPGRDLVRLRGDDPVGVGGAVTFTAFSFDATVSFMVCDNAWEIEDELLALDCHGCH